MRALVFGSPRTPPYPEPKPVGELEEQLASLPFGLHDVDDPVPSRPGWVLTRPLLAGICGSDSKMILGDFNEGDIDNPMAAFSSLPYVPGHEVVAEVMALGPGAHGVEPGQRVVLNPWLSCAPRGISPLCPACEAGDYSLCWSFTDGDIGPGVHIGVTAGASGGWADLMVAHDSMLIAVPDAIPDELAVLADPFAVSLHAVIRNAPPAGGRVLVYGAGALGMTTLAVLRALYPDVEVAVIARFPAQAALARALGAAKIIGSEDQMEAAAIVDELAAWSGGILHPALAGLPMTHPGGIDVVYDTIAKPETLEIGIRLLKSRGSLVWSGVHTPGRFEWTPIYFKELRIVGSNAFGMEEVRGVRQHAISHYLDMVAAGEIELSGMLTHRFALGRWWDAVLALARQQESGAIKVAFEPRAEP
ncbi:MAG: zinc-dependent alcohol dehydrogenase [Acidimicrobiales bacterium]